MNKVLHICNTNFEWEIMTNSRDSIQASLLSHPYFLQLQFLPFLYAKPGDGVLVSHRPSTTPSHLNLHCFNEDIDYHQYSHLETWGWSQAIKRWTPLPYHPPENLKALVSKTFVFNHCPQLPGSVLLYSLEDIQQWISKGPYPKVIKSSFGCSGNNKWIFEFSKKLPKALIKTFTITQPFIGEPWVKRTLDFSTQWILNNGIRYLGSTIMKNTAYGSYQKTLLNQNIPHLNIHFKHAYRILKKLLDAGFYGHVGIDGMLYANTIHPIVEINLRKTMGWLALALDKNIEYTSGGNGPLPTSLNIGKKITFNKQMKLL